MNIIKTSFLALSLAMPCLAFAEGGGDIVFEKMSQANGAAIAKQELKREGAIAQGVDYKYGMDLDIKKVIKTSPPSKKCGPAPAEMTYEDSRGELHTINYIKHGTCDKK